MANIHFYLKSGKENKLGQKSIVMRITYGSTRTIIFLNKMIQPKFWNSNKQIVRAPNQRENENNNDNINETIKAYRNKAEDAIRNATNNNLTLTDFYFKAWFSNTHSGAMKKNRDFFELFDDYLNANKAEKTVRTILGYTTIRNFLQAFQLATRFPVDIKNIDHEFMDALKKYAFSERKIQHNYFAKIVSVLKSFLNWVSERDIKISEHYRKFSFPEKEIAIIFLTIEELMLLYNYDFKNKRLNNARDLYCFGCFTGLRVSDIIELCHEHIRGNNIHKTIRKTKTNEIIPLNPFALEILKKHEANPLKPLPIMTGQKLNEYIKECCRIVDISEPINIVKFYGGKTEEKTHPKWELITTHTARKTFITNSILLGMNYMAARAMSGHKRDKNFNRYLKIAEDFKTKEMERTWGQLGKVN